MDANEQLLNTFSTRVGRIAELERQLDQAQKDYNALMTARMIEISDTDMESAQKRIAKLIREVNRCITLLSEQ